MLWIDLSSACPPSANVTMTQLLRFSRRAYRNPKPSPARERSATLRAVLCEAFGLYPSFFASRLACCASPAG